MISKGARSLEHKPNSRELKRTLQSPDSAFEDDDETLPVLNTNADFSVPSFSRVFYADGKKEDEQVENSADCEDPITKDQPATSQEPVFVVDPNISPGTSDTEVTMQNAQLFESTSSQPYLHLPNSFDNVDFAEFLNAISQSCSKPPMEEMVLNAKRRKVSSPRKRLAQPVNNKIRLDKKRRQACDPANTTPVSSMPSISHLMNTTDYNFSSIQFLNRILCGQPTQLFETANVDAAVESTVDTSTTSDLNSASIATMLMALGVDSDKMMEQDFVANALSNFIATSGVVNTASNMDPEMVVEENGYKEPLVQVPNPAPGIEPASGPVRKNPFKHHKIPATTNTATKEHIIQSKHPKNIEEVPKLCAQPTKIKPNHCDDLVPANLPTVDLNGSEANKMHELVSNFFLNANSANLPANQMKFNSVFNNTKTGTSQQQANFLQEFITNLGKFGLESGSSQWFSPKELTNSAHGHDLLVSPQQANVSLVKARDTNSSENTQPDERKRKRPRTTSKALFTSSSTAKANLIAANNNKTVSGNLHAVANSKPCSGAEFLELEDLEEFANNFKKQRIKHGFTQGDVGLALGKRYGTDFSQTTISRFEALNLSYKNMCKLRPLLKEWLEEAETLIENGATVIDILEAPSPNYHSGQSAHSSEAQNDSGCVEEEEKHGSPSLPISMPRFLNHSTVPQLKRRRKRTNLDNAQKAALDVFFADNCRPDHQRMNDIAASLDLDPDVVRVWFCNRRQKIRSKV